MLLWSPSCFTYRSPTFLPALSIASGCCGALPVVLASSWINRTRLNVIWGRWCPWGTPGRAVKVSSGHGTPWSEPTKQCTCSPPGLKVMHCLGNLTTTCEGFFQEAASPSAFSSWHVLNGPTSQAAKPGFQLSVAHWKSVQKGFKSITEISSKDKSTLRERTNITCCGRKKIQIRCREQKWFPTSFFACITRQWWMPFVQEQRKFKQKAAQTYLEKKPFVDLYLQINTFKIRLMH